MMQTHRPGTARCRRLAATMLCAALVGTACGDGGDATAAPSGAEATPTSDASAEEPTGTSTADPELPTYRQGFDGDADGWVGTDVEGSDGWCGTIVATTDDDGPVSPSTGTGYAMATGGECNEYWAEIFGAEFRSGPYAAGTPMADHWPAGGFVLELDVHLDPGTTPDFDYYAAISLLDVRAEEGLFPSIQYFEIPVRNDDDALRVNGHTVEADGWHTFLFRFGEDEAGMLTVGFELATGGSVVATDQVTTTSLFGEPGDATDSFSAANVGNGYVWLHLAEDDTLAIDEYSLSALQ